MKAKLIYVECSETSFGYGNQNKNSIVEIDGKYYKVNNYWNFQGSGRSITEIEIDPNNLPEEYSRMEYQQHYWLEHRNGEEFEIDLTSYKPDRLPKEFQDLAMKQIELKQKEQREKHIAKVNSEIESLACHKTIEEADLTDEQRNIAQKIIARIKQELIEDENLQLKNYASIIEDIVPISKGESVIVTHKFASYSRPEDHLIPQADFLSDDGPFFPLATTHEFGRDTKPYVLPLTGKSIKLKDGSSYLGSYWIQGYSIDLRIDEQGKPYINRNVYENWANNQHYESIVDVNLPVDRFDISTGEEGSFKDYNEQVREKKAAKKEFYIGVMKQAKEQFGLSEEQAKIILNFAGTVSALSLTTDFDKSGLTTEQALDILRKNSHKGIEGVLSEIGMKYPSYKFDVIQRAAETLAYINTLQENKRNITPSEIAEGISPRQGEMSVAMNETVVENQTENDQNKGPRDDE